MTPSPRTVCVFCGSRPGMDPRFLEAARELGRLISERKYDVVYGGGTIGAMGALAQSTIEHGGRVHGIIPQAIMDTEVEGGISDKYGQRTVVNDMHTRKQIMEHEADAFIALPGGYGTLEELFEIITWSQLGIHGKPIVILNIAGYYDGIMAWLKKSVKEGFVVEDNGEILVEAKSPEEALEKIESYQLPKGRYSLNWNGLSPTKDFDQ
ncbi:LOG family protein isoform A [Neolecta irregularis DAH-3]|nr:LOG family protein isoform A [Neolecta irregularis DAH-3]|eukprot:OLL23077.1 LOG family protein isoform A [Neolecta irregularis DAH-3]